MPRMGFLSISDANGQAIFDCEDVQIPAVEILLLEQSENNKYATSGI
jgi:hypothetical protein